MGTRCVCHMHSGVLVDTYGKKKHAWLNSQLMTKMCGGGGGGGVNVYVTTNDAKYECACEIFLYGHLIWSPKSSFWAVGGGVGGRGGLKHPSPHLLQPSRRLQLTCRRHYKSHTSGQGIFITKIGVHKWGTSNHTGVWAVNYDSH